MCSTPIPTIPFWASFRAGSGSNDFVVAVHPWVEGAFLVFCRKSIWIATVNQFASTDGTGFSIDTPVTNLQLLTDEVGCAARRSIQTAGAFVYFLSDAGVYRLDSQLDLKLRGDTKPLSPTPSLTSSPTSTPPGSTTRSVCGIATATTSPSPWPDRTTTTASSFTTR
jgi:hypothetical protein